jgi:hypothetical protein
MIDAKKLGDIFRKRKETTLVELIQEVDGCEDLPKLLQKLIDAGIVEQDINKEGTPYSLTKFGRELLGSDE